MKKVFLSMIAAAMLLAACNQTAKTANTADSSAQTAASQMATPVTATVTNGSGAIMHFEHVMHDFGKAKDGDKVTYQFKFTNEGKGPLIITNAVASCGCTTPDWPKSPIKPGGSGFITVTFNTAGRPGLADKMITITANTTPTQSAVHLVGEVIGKK